MPWRETTDPYKIWLSEIILQQTRVAQGLPYYERFVQSYPTVQDLAAATEEQVLKSWQGLGYYSRGRNLHYTAQYITQELEGKFPSTYKELLKLKGVGDYTASAIASICFNEPTAVVDGNVYRVLARVYGIDTPINTSQGKKEFKALAQELLDPGQPANFNQALMEFGAIACKPKNPACDSCIFNEDCSAFRSHKINSLPVKLSKTKIKKRFLNYLVFSSQDNTTLVQQRTSKGIWQGLYEFPVIEMEGNGERFRESALLKEQLDPYKVVSIQKYNEKPILHKLSHQHLRITFWIIAVKKLPEGIAITKLKSYPVPIVIARFIDEFLESKTASLLF